MTMKSIACLLSISLVVASSSSLAAPYSPPTQKRAVVPDAATTVGELLFVPVDHCLVFNSAAKAPIPVNAWTTYYVAGAVGFGGQGGTLGGCGVPANAKAVSIGLTTSTSSADGYVAAYGLGLTATSQRATSMQAGKTVTGSTVASLGPTGRLRVRPFGGSTNIAGVVTGYYLEQIQGNINADGSINSKTSRVLSVDHPSVGVYAIHSDRDTVSCAASGSAWNNFVYVKTLTNFGNQTDVLVWRLVNGAETLVDEPFSFSIHC